jgi:hypothetical protein
MSIHFFFNYREHLVKQLKEQYESLIKQKKEELVLQIQLEEAECLIRDYFDVVAAELQEVLEAANNDVKLEYDSDDFIVRFKIIENYVRFIRRSTSIEVEIGRYNEELGLVESYILAYIIPGEKKCHTRKVGMVHESGSFDENSLNFFMREAFGEISSHEESELV